MKHGMTSRTAVVIALFAIAFAGCGGDDDNDGASDGDGTEMTAVRVYFVDEARFEVGDEPYVRAVTRDVPAADAMQGALDALFAGPAEDETGLAFVASGATGAQLIGVVDAGVVRVELVGGCASGGSTLTVAAEIVPTLKEFAEVTAVKMLDTDGETETPYGPDDSIPFCLEP